MVRKTLIQGTKRMPTHSDGPGSDVKDKGETSSGKKNGDAPEEAHLLL